MAATGKKSPAAVRKVKAVGSVLEATRSDGVRIRVDVLAPNLARVRMTRGDEFRASGLERYGFLKDDWPAARVYLMGAAGIGALAGSLYVASLSDLRRKGLLLLIAAVMFGVFLVLFSQSTLFYLSLFLLLGVGMASSSYMATNNTLLLIHAEDRVRGRVMSLYMMTIGLYPMAVLPAAAIAESVGAPVAVAVGGGILILFTLAMAAARPALRRL